MFEREQHAVSLDSGCLVRQLNSSTAASDVAVFIDARSDVRWHANTAAEATSVCEGPWKASWFCNPDAAAFQSMRDACCEAYKHHPPYSCTRRLERSWPEIASLSYTFAHTVHLRALTIVPAIQASCSEDIPCHPHCDHDYVRVMSYYIDPVRPRSSGDIGNESTAPGLRHHQVPAIPLDDAPSSLSQR